MSNLIDEIYNISQVKDIIENYKKISSALYDHLFFLANLLNEQNKIYCY